MDKKCQRMMLVNTIVFDSTIKIYQQNVKAWNNVQLP